MWVYRDGAERAHSGHDFGDQHEAVLMFRFPGCGLSVFSSCAEKPLRQKPPQWESVSSAHSSGPQSIVAGEPQPRGLREHVLGIHRSHGSREQ